MLGGSCRQDHGVGVAGEQVQARQGRGLPSPGAGVGSPSVEASQQRLGSRLAGVLWVPALSPLPGRSSRPMFSAQPTPSFPLTSTPVQTVRSSAEEPAPLPPLMLRLEAPGRPLGLQTDG